MTLLALLASSQVQSVTFTSGWMPAVYMLATVMIGFVLVAALALYGSASKDRPAILTALGGAFWWLAEVIRWIFRGAGPGGPGAA